MNKEQIEKLREVMENYKANPHDAAAIGKWHGAIIQAGPALVALAERALLAAAPAPIQQDHTEALYQYASSAQAGAWLDCSHEQMQKHASSGIRTRTLYATPPALAGSQVQAAGDEVNEREAFETMVKERFVTTKYSLARAHPYGYYNTVSSDTFGGRRQPDYANVQMLWDVWDARATIAKKSMREQP